jgi:sec-independent protein translocase protein TatC
MSEDQNQTLIEHLLELRTRIIRALIAVLVVFLAMVAFANPIYEAVSEPLRSMMPEGSNMIATDVASPFLAPLKLSAMLSLFIAMPIVLYQLWAFIAPGLYSKEKAVAIPIFTSSVVLFYLGMAFAYFVVFPLVFGFFTTIGPDSVAVMTDINSYLSFVLKLFLAFGLAFEIPVATFVLIRAGVISRENLASKRPLVLVGCFIFGMFLTPPDIFSQALLAIPMYALFELGLLFSRNKVAEQEDSAAEKSEEKE